MSKLRVRVYNVGFGDAVLVTVPDKSADGGEETRHILIDVGNVLTGEAGTDADFYPIVENILGELAGRPLDMFVMTHEHMDHVQGLFYVYKNSKSNGLRGASLVDKLKVQHAWLTASSDPHYYDSGKHPKAKKQLDERQSFFRSLQSYLVAAPNTQTPWLRQLMTINNPRAVGDCVAFLRELTKTPPTLWCVLIVAEGPLKLTLSITSGYSVPWTR